MIHRDVTTTVGGTPMVELARVARGLPGRIAAKLEMRNPCGSVKDRVGVALIEDAEGRGPPGTTLVEATAAPASWRRGRPDAAGREETRGKLVVVLLADTGERYATTPLFASGGPASGEPAAISAPPLPPR